MPDNERIYIGDVVLDQDNQDMFRQWLLEIINSLQGHTNGFNADMVDGFHATDFATAEQGLLAETSLQEGLTIGSIQLANTSNSQFIKTDGVQITEELASLFDDLSEISLVTDLLLNLYSDYNQRFQDFDDKKVDKEEGKGLSHNDFSDNYKDMLDNLNILYQEVQCGNETKTILNAQAVNGLQFILTTKELYNSDAYTDAQKNCWNNIFIFVDEDDYPDEYESPLDCPIGTGYVFRIHEYDNGKVYLQYKGRLAQDWLDLIEINELYSQFVTYGDFESKIRAIANEITTAAIGEVDTVVHIGNLIKQMDAPDIDDWQDYPFISSDIDFVSDVTRNGHSLVSEDQDTGLKIADLDSIITEAQNLISTSLSPLQQKLNTIQSGATQTVIDDSFKSNSTNPVQNKVINDSINRLNSEIASLNNSITSASNSLNNRINSLENIIREIRPYTQYLIMGVGRYDGGQAITGFNESLNFNQTEASFLNINNCGDILEGSGIDDKLSQLVVTNRGSIKKTDGTYKYDNPDFIYIRLMHQYTAGYEQGEYRNPYIFITINGKSYAKCMIDSNGNRKDYVTLNIRLDAGVYQVNAFYVDNKINNRPFGDPDVHIYASRQLVVEKKYSS